MKLPSKKILFACGLLFIYVLGFFLLPFAAAPKKGSMNILALQVDTHLYRNFYHAIPGQWAKLDNFRYCIMLSERESMICE